MRPVYFALSELRSYLRDKGDLAFSFLLPIVLLAIMLGAFGQEEQFNGVACIVDEDQGSYSRQIIDRLKEVNGLTVRLESATRADAKLDKATISLAVFIPRGFSQSVADGQPAHILFKQRGNGGQEGQIVASIVSGVVQSVASDAAIQVQVQKVLAGSGIPATVISSTVEQYLSAQHSSPTVTVAEESTGQKPDMLYLFLPGVITMFALFAISLRAQALIEERQKGTLERLMVTRLGIGELFLGKFLAGFARGFVQVLVLLVLAAIVFRFFTVASFFSTLFVATLFVAAVSAIGLLIASAARTRDQASWAAVIVTLVMSMLGGTFFEVNSGFLHVVSRFTVNWYANDALRKLITGDDVLWRLGPQMAVIAAVGIVALLVARFLFKAVSGGSRR